MKSSLHLDEVPGDEQVVEVFGGTSLCLPDVFGTVGDCQPGGRGSTRPGSSVTYMVCKGVRSLTLPTLAPAFGMWLASIFNPPNPTRHRNVPDDLAGTLGNTTNYVSALFQSPASTRWDVFTFGPTHH